MPNSIITLFRHLTGSLLLLFLAVSCRQDESLLPSAPGKGATAEVTLSVRIPDFRAANTRGVDEKGITEITVLMFAARKSGILTESVTSLVSPLPDTGGTGRMSSSCRHESTSGSNNRTDSRLRNGMMIELLGIIYCFMICIS